MAKETIERALQALESPDESVREKAIVLLVRTRSPRALPSLEKVAHTDPSLKIRFLAKEGLQTVRLSLTQEADLEAPAAGPTAAAGPRPIDLERLAKLLGDEDPKVRIKATKAAMAYMNPQALRVLLPHVKRERNLKVKGNVVLALGLLGGRDQLPLLLHYLEHKEPHLRARAAQGLCNIPDVAVYPRLVHSLGDRNAEVRAVAFAALLRLGKPKLVKLLTKMAASPQDWMRLASARACGKFRSSQVLAVLATSLRDQDQRIRRTARASLRRLHRKGMAQAGQLLDDYRRGGGEMTSTELDLPVGLESPLNDPDARVRLAEVARIMSDRDTSLLDLVRRRIDVDDDERVKASLLLALGKLGGPASMGELQRFLADPQRRIRASAVEALSFVDDPGVVGLLTPLLHDPDNRTRANAIMALRDAPGVDLIGPLTELATSDDRNCKLSAVYAICELGRPEATALLDLLAADPDELVRRRVEQARTMLADSRLMQPSSRDAIQSARLDIPQELTAPAPHDEPSPPSTATGSPLSALLSAPSGATEAPNLESAVIAPPKGSRRRTGTASAPQTPTGPAPAEAAAEAAPTSRKNQPGMRTQIDALFAKAEEEKDKLKQPRKATREAKAPGKPVEEVSRTGLLDKVRNFFAPPAAAAKDAEPGSLQARNIVLLGGAIVILFFAIYFLASGSDSYEDESFDSADF